MRVFQLVAFSLCLAVAHAANAQVGVETGALTSGSAGTAGALSKLGSALSRSVTGSANALGNLSGRAAASSSVSLSPTQSSFNRFFVPRGSGGYVAGVQWRTPGVTPVTLRVGADEVIGTTAAPLLLPFQASAAVPCTMVVRAAGNLPSTGLVGDLEVVRAAAPGEPHSKSLLTVQQRLAEFSRRGPRPSVWPLLANLAERHLAHVAEPTDLDRLLDTALLRAPGVTAADLQAVVHEYEALPDETKVQCFTAGARALRSTPAPALAHVVDLLGQSSYGGGGGLSATQGGATPRITGIGPALPPGGAYPPGAVIQIVGHDFSAQAEGNQVYLGTELPRVLSGGPHPVSAATPTSLQFQLPATVPEGSIYLLVMVNRTHMSPAWSLQVSKAATMPVSPAPALAPVTSGRYRLSGVKLECVSETSPKWWADDDVAVLTTAVADGQVVTRASGLYRSFSDAKAEPLLEGDRRLLPADQRDWDRGVGIAEGLGLAVGLWAWPPPGPDAGLGPWALREAFANALVAPRARFDAPRPQTLVSQELAVWADPIGEERVSWTAADLERLLAPGQKLTRAIDVYQGGAAIQPSSAAHYRLYVEVERLAGAQ